MRISIVLFWVMTSCEVTLTLKMEQYIGIHLHEYVV